MSKLTGKKIYLQFYAEKFCLFKPMKLTLSQVSYSSSGTMKLSLYSWKLLYFSVSGYSVGLPGKPWVHGGGSALRLTSSNLAVKNSQIQYM